MGELTEFTIRLLVIGLPGIICHFVTRKFIATEPRSPYETTLLIFVYSIVSYLLVGLFYKSTLDAISLFVDSGQPIDPRSVRYALVVGILLPFPLSLAHRLNLLNRIARFLKVTKRFGSEDIWHNFLNSPESNGKIYIRDYRCNLVYHGKVLQFSESRESRELLLWQVSVYSNIEEPNTNEPKSLYNVKFLYLARNRDDLTLEVPHPQ